MKTLTPENYEIDNQQNNKIKGTFLHFQPIKIPSQGTKSETVQSKSNSKG